MVITLNVSPAINNHHNVFYMMPIDVVQVYHLYDEQQQRFLSLPVLLLGENLFCLYLYSNLYSLSGWSYPGKEKCRNEAINNIAVPKTVLLKGEEKINE